MGLSERNSSWSSEDAEAAFDKRHISGVDPIMGFARRFPLYRLYQQKKHTNTHGRTNVCIYICTNKRDCDMIIRDYGKLVLLSIIHDCRVREAVPVIYCVFLF